VDAYKRKENRPKKNPDGWPPVVLKEIAQQIFMPLHMIFSKSLNTGHVPDNWKKSLLVPIYKKGSFKQASNYRPIPLTLIIGKILESIVRDALLHHFNSYNLLPYYQHGFIPGESLCDSIVICIR